MDDNTIWTAENTNVGQMNARLQEAIEAVEIYLASTGLECSPEKLELLLHHPMKMGSPPRALPNFTSEELYSSVGERLGSCNVYGS